VISFSLIMENSWLYTAYGIFRKSMKSNSPADIIGAIADNRSLDLFDSIARGTSESEQLKDSKGLTRKQYYSRTGRLLRVGLIKRNKGKFSLTTLGTVVYHAQIEIEKAVKNYWKLKAIDSIQSSTDIGEQERVKLIKTILDDSTIENVLVKNK
jgi:predicted transcriptional regulator